MMELLKRFEEDAADDELALDEDDPDEDGEDEEDGEAGSVANVLRASRMGR